MKAAVAFTLLFAVALAQSGTTTIGMVRLQGTVNDPDITGFVHFYLENSGQITVAADIKGITVNTGVNHGLHIHQYGDLFTNDGNSVGGHLNPANAAHGCPESTTRHLGDTGNWMVNADGTIFANKTLDLIALTGSNSIIGAGFILHQLTDDCIETTSSGKRLAQGVIGVANPTPFGYAQNSAAPAGTAQSPSGSTVQAVCILQGATAQNANAASVTGYVYFSQTDKGIAVSAVINGLTDTRPRGFHIHQWGDLTNNTGSGAGPHWTGQVLDPAINHSIPGSGNQHHIGDMGNLQVFDSKNGSAYYYNVLDSFGIFGNNINSVIGRAIVVHNLTDDCTGTNGNAGARIAHCVIGIANPSYSGNQTVLSSVSSTQDVSKCPSTSQASYGEKLLVPATIVVLLFVALFDLVALW